MARDPNVPIHEALPSDLDGYSLNACGNPDCVNFGVVPVRHPHHASKEHRANADARDDRGRYTVTGTKSRREDDEDGEGASASRPRDPFKTFNLECAACSSRQSIQSNQAFDEEVRRLTGEVDRIAPGPECPECGVRYMDPAHHHEFILNGAHGKGVRLIHVCGTTEDGRALRTRFTYTPSHRRHARPQENLEILQKLINSGGLNDILRAMSTGRGRRMGVSRLYDRIFWLEAHLLAYERAQWMDAEPRLHEQIAEHRLAFDTADVNVNWETAEDRRNTVIKCNVTADVESGYVLRADAAFDGDIDPVRFFIENVGPKSGNRLCGFTRRGEKLLRYPLRYYQRPTARFEERLFYPSALHHVAHFVENVVARVGDLDQRERLIKEGRRLYRQIKRTYVNYYGIGRYPRETRAPFEGAVVAYKISLAAHLEAVRRLIQPSKIMLYTDANTAAVRYVPHVFREELNRDWFTWAAVFLPEKNLNYQRPQKLVAKSRRHYKAWFEEKQLNGPFSSYKRDYVMEFMAPHPIPNSAFRLPQFRSSPWVRSPLSTMYEPKKIVGLLLPPRRLRARLKESASSEAALSAPIGASAHEAVSAVNARRTVANLVQSATLQPVDTFFNSLRERLSPTGRAERGAGRSPGTFIRGNLFNPRVLVALLNIYRISYNFFELRPYVRDPIEALDAAKDLPPLQLRRHRVVWSDEVVEVVSEPRRSPDKLSPAMRYGLHRKPDAGEPAKVDLVSVLSTPWEVYGTPLFEKLMNRKADLRRNPARGSAKPD